MKQHYGIIFGIVNLYGVLERKHSCSLVKTCVKNCCPKRDEFDMADQHEETKEYQTLMDALIMRYKNDLENAEDMDMAQLVGRLTREVNDMKKLLEKSK